MPQGVQGPQGPAGPAGGKLLFGSKHVYNLFPTAETVYFSPVHTEEDTSESFDVVGVAPVACTMTNLAVKVSLGHAGVTMTFTFRKGTTIANLTDTTLGCNITLATTFCTDTDSIALNAGDLFSFKVVYNAGATGSDDVFYTDLICQ